MNRKPSIRCQGFECWNPSKVSLWIINIFNTYNPIEKYRRHDRRNRIDLNRHICRHLGRPLLHKHVCKTAFLLTPPLLYFCLFVFLRPISLPLCAFFNSTPIYSNTDLCRSCDLAYRNTQAVPRTYCTCF